MHKSYNYKLAPALIDCVVYFNHFL